MNPQRALLPRQTSLLTGLVSLLLLGACTTPAQFGYNTGQALQLQQCQKLQDRDERQRCEKSNSTPYDKYRAEAQAVRGEAGATPPVKAP